MLVRPWDRDKDYDTLVKWWKQWEFGVVPKECLPPEGVVVELDGKPICASGLYVGEGTQFGFMEWVVSDKQAEPRKLHESLKLCIVTPCSFLILVKSFLKSTYCRLI